MHRAWNDVAEIRRKQIEEGRDLTFSRVFVPLFRDKVKRFEPKNVLEVGAGTGHLARELSVMVERYVALEPAARMYEIAKELNAETSAEIQNCTVEQFVSPEKFDLVISHMCVQTVPNLDAFVRALSKRLSTHGHFLISLPHPAFYNDYKRFFPADDYCYMSEMTKDVTFSISLDPHNLLEGVPYNHRPLSRYISAIVDAGLHLTELIEVFPSESIQALYGRKWESPRYLIFVGWRN